MLQDGSYVCHELAPETRRGTITDGEMHNGKMRYIFHLDPRFSDAATFPDVYFYDYELVECERPSDAEIAIINKLAKLGS
jgi:hypothetical protein